MLDKRLNDKGKNWRHVLKALKVMDYCLHEGSELVVTWAKQNVFIIKTLREFQYIDEDGKDQGQNGRRLIDLRCLGDVADMGIASPRCRERTDVAYYRRRTTEGGAERSEDLEVSGDGLG